MLTTTAGDYTVSFGIKEKFYADFKIKHKINKDTNDHDSSWAEYFLKWITNEMELRCTDSPNQNCTCCNPKGLIRVAFTTIAFDNREMIYLLRERGEYIKTEKWDKMH